MTLRLHDHAASLHDEKDGQKYNSRIMPQCANSKCTLRPTALLSLLPDQ